MQMKTIASYFLAFLASLLIFVGLPLLGWGIRDLPRFFDHPARSLYIMAIFILQLLAVLYNPQVGRRPEHRKSGVPQHKIDLLLIQIFSLAIVFLAPFSDGHSFAALNISGMGRYAGLILMIPGFLLMQAAEKHLDKQFSIQVTLQEDHKLIQSGPYKYIRHPRYLGILLFFLGISLTFQSLIGMLLILALTLVFVWRIYTEEALLQQEFGKEWEAYRNQSWRMFPFIF
jgi:protein-S-isoprenylcysteine O-methyltransferase Ste14